MAKGNYVDGFVIPIPKKNTAAYKKMATEGCRIWKRFGALDYKECMIDDATPPYTKRTFPKMVKTKPGEVVWFSFIVFKSRAHRDAVNKKVHAYFAKTYGQDMSMEMPFDLTRFSYGGFKVVVAS
jgi:alkaline phosphatase